MLKTKTSSNSAIQKGLILFAGDPRGDYIAVELVDGRLYFIHNFGRRERRTQFSQRIVADGQAHEVEMRFYGSHVDLRVDDVRERLDLTSGERLPASLGTMYVAGFPNYQQLPWMVWSRESYLGCLTDLRVRVCLPVCLFFCVSVCIFVWLCLSVSVFVSVSVCLSVSLSLILSLSVSVFVSVSVCLSVCLSPSLSLTHTHTCTHACTHTFTPFGVVSMRKLEQNVFNYTLHK